MNNTSLVPFDVNGDGKADLAFSRSSYDANGTYIGEEYAVWTLNGTQVTGQAVLGTAAPGWYVRDLADFDGNGTTDLLFSQSLTNYSNSDYSNGISSYEYSSTEQFAVWTVNGTQVTGQAVLGSVENSRAYSYDYNNGNYNDNYSYQYLRDLSDLDSNGTTDLLFRKNTYDYTNGSNSYQEEYSAWTVDGTQVTGQAVLGTIEHNSNSNSNWYVRDIGAFDGNGADLLFQQSAYDANNTYIGEQYAVWTVDGTQVTGQAVLGTTEPDSDWYVEDIADFDGNGTTDLLFQQSAYDANNTYIGEQYAVWTVNGTQVTGQAVLGTAGSDWNLEYLADFDGNSTTDLLFSQSAYDANNSYIGEQYAVWTINGTQVTGQAIVGTAGSEWDWEDDNDFDGNGSTDLLFERSTYDANNVFTGQEYAVWLLNGAEAPVQKVVGNTGADWSYLGSGDINGDGTADLTFVNYGTSEIGAWTFDTNGSVMAQAVIGTFDDPSNASGWSPIG